MMDDNVSKKNPFTATDLAIFLDSSGSSVEYVVRPGAFATAAAAAAAPEAARGAADRPRHFLLPAASGGHTASGHQRFS